MSYIQEKEVAIQACMAAAQLCEQVRQNIPEAIAKEDRSPVTVADFGAQAIVCKALSEAFPSDPVVGEEEAATLKDKPEVLEQVTNYVKNVIPTATPEQVVNWIDHGKVDLGNRYWTLDPIDGTKGFLRQDQYAIALALIEDGIIKVGVLACPALSFHGEQGLLFVAVRGEGATMMSLSGANPKTIKVSESSEKMRFVESVESGHGNQTQQSAIAQKVGITTSSLRMDSQAKYAAVAAGEAALYLRLPSPKTPDYREKIWDHAAGVIVVEEAGGKVTDMHGKPLDFSLGAKLINNQGVVVSNAKVHDAVIAALSSGVKNNHLNTV
jgi:3'(2'), 5'-bisphosphate nucleotidase